MSDYSVAVGGSTGDYAATDANLRSKWNSTISIKWDNTHVPEYEVETEFTWDEIGWLEAPNFFNQIDTVVESTYSVALSEPISWAPIEQEPTNQWKLT